MLFRSARIDSSGRLLVGTSSTSAPALLNIQGYSGSNTGEGIIYLQKGSTSPANGDTIGNITFADSNSNRCAQIYSQRDGGTWTSGTSQPGRLVFSTTADGAPSPTERMRITNDGRIGIKETSFLGNVALAIGSSSTTNNDVYLRNNGTQHLNLSFIQSSLTSKAIRAATDDRIYVFSNSDTATGVYMAAGATSWTGTSDERAKTDLVEISNGLSKVSSLRAVTGRFSKDPEEVSRSFLIAQDVQAVLPEAVDSTDPDELGLRYTEVIPLLVAALKESKERIETLEAKVAALEAS